MAKVRRLKAWQAAKEQQEKDLIIPSNCEYHDYVLSFSHLIQYLVTRKSKQAALAKKDVTRFLSVILLLRVDHSMEL